MLEIPRLLFPVPRGRWVFWHAECWFSSIGVFCADNHNYFQFKLKGTRRSAGGAATQYFAKVVDVPVVQLHRCCSSFDGLTFLAVYTGTRPGVPPPSGRGRGGGDAGSLLPGVLPPELGASSARARTDSPCRESSEPHTPPPPPHTTTPHTPPRHTHTTTPHTRHTHHKAFGSGLTLCWPVFLTLAVGQSWLNALCGPRLAAANVGSGACGATNSFLFEWRWPQLEVPCCGWYSDGRSCSSDQIRGSSTCGGSILDTCRHL